MCRTPLTALRSMASTIRKGDRAGRRKECRMEGAGLLVAKGVGDRVRGVWRIVKNFLELVALVLRTGGEARIS